MQANVSNEAQVQEMFRKTIDAFGSLDVLVNNGIQKPMASHEVEMADFDRVISVNLRSRSSARAKQSGTFCRARAGCDF